MYIWTAYGQYVTSGRLKQLMPYEEKFELAEADKPNARSIIHRMINDRLVKNIKDFSRVHTCQVQDAPEAAKDSGKTNKELEVAMLQAVDMGCVPANYSELGTDDLRIGALKEAIEKKKQKVKRLSKDKTVEDQGWV